MKTNEIRFLACLGLLLNFRLLAGLSDGSGPALSVPKELPPSARVELPKPNWIDQSRAAAWRKSEGCLECHAGIEPMHDSANVVLGCTDCHGGNATPGLTEREAHVAPRNPVFWQSSALPNGSSVLLNHESAAFIRFVNPGDLRVAQQACGLCHGKIVQEVSHSIMRHGAMLWGAALYNNGAFPEKNYRFGQAYGADGAPLRLVSPVPVTPEMTRKHGILPYIDPLPRFELSQPGNILRIFERGGVQPPALADPDPFEDPGKPAHALSDRGLGTLLRTDPVFLNLQKTRLNDPLLDFLGSNNHPGDYRSSGCSACHVVFANDRSPTDSGWYYKYGSQGLSFSGDKAIPKNERGHPIIHQFTRAIPSSQCMVCHMHQGNLFVNPYLGYTWWDEETDGEWMYPKQQKNPTAAELTRSVENNPEAAAARGLWGNLDFLEKVAQLNSKLKDTQFADYHGHGWIFRAVFLHDRQGNLLDRQGNIIPFDAPDKFARAVHLEDEHLRRGMQCVDCHFDGDVHGNGLLYGESRAATTIECIDCHGTIEKRPTLITSGNGGKDDLRADNTPWGPRFFWIGKRLYQRSEMTPDLVWEIPQTVDTIDPKSPFYDPASAYAKTLLRDGVHWGAVPKPGQCPRKLAHDNSNVNCEVCHTSWATSCFGCHLPMRANQRVPLNKYEGILTRNFTSYNPQVVRDDVFQLGIDATYKHHRMAVIRSSSAVVVSSQNANREWVYSQQQTISAEGFSGQAYNPCFMHTTSGIGTTKNCEDCHVSKANDNNAWMASLLGFGTGTVNFFGRFAYVAEGRGGLDAVPWTEQADPQAAYGSHLQEIAYPDDYGKFVDGGRRLKEGYHEDADNILDIQLRGEYLYTADGPGGFRVFDVANVDNKGFSQRITSAPVSPLGQRTDVPTPYATSVTLPSTLADDPLRTHRPVNEEQAVSPIYAWVFVTDRKEGLVMVTVGTLLDGDPENNFFGREKIIRFNPGGKLTGAEDSFMAGTNLYVVGRNGLFVVGLHNDSLTAPGIVGEVTSGLKNPRAVGVQFRYLFVTDDDGFKVLDITDPTKPKTIPGAFVPLKHAHRFYLARTYAYVADGPDGLAFIDITNPEKPRLERLYTAGGKLNDTRAVQVGSISASEFALVADGRNGLRVIQLISPENVPGAMGFSPVPNPKLIATFYTRGPALAVSRGLDRDRVVDESGNQTVVFGRRGSRPFYLDEMEKFYERDGRLYTVQNVRVRDGYLITRAGTELKPTWKFQRPPLDNGTPPPPAAEARLMRRGE
ncbi:MAG: hypothetical protein KGJ88_05430 [Verrucomicrobiota bacterium]|nr:hypothetical protein [Verrucomicrobiota bacterium]